MRVWLERPEAAAWAAVAFVAIAPLGLALIEELEIGPAHVVGHSYGAYVALALAVDHGHLVRSLVLGEPPVLPLLSHSSVGAALRDAWNTRVRAPAQEAALDGRLDDAQQGFSDAVIHPGWFDELDPEARAALIREAGPEFRVPEAGHVIFTNRSFFDDAVLSFLLEH